MKRLFAALMVCTSLLSAQEVPGGVPEPVPPPAGPARKVIATGLAGGILAGSLVSSYFDWWKDNSSRFHFTDDGLLNNYSLGIDKVGHAFTSYFYFHTIRNVLLWGGYDSATALWWSAGTAAVFAVSIEIGDGLSSYGFSIGDLAFNSFGLGYGILQTQLPALRNFTLKWSYVPEEGYRWPPHFTDHYDAHTYWLAMNMHNLLPESVRDYWPSWLQLAVGYGVDDRQTRREFVFGFDLDIGAFRTENADLRLVQSTATYIHLPSPAVKFTKGKATQVLPVHWH